MIRTTMVGSWFRTTEIMKILNHVDSPTGEISERHSRLIADAEIRAVRDQLHPGGISRGLDWVSNGEQRKAGYSWFLPNRFEGFSDIEKVVMPLHPSFVQEMRESSPQTLAPRQGNDFSVPRIKEKLSYTGRELASNEARDAVKIANKEGAKRIFLPSPSPGVVTICFPREKVYGDHYEYLFDVTRELRKEYKAILEVDGIDLQIDAPDLAMGKQRGVWGVDFFEALPRHIDAINEAIAGLPGDRIRVHYCYGNWVGSHIFDADYAKVLPEILRLKVGTIVGEMANPRHEGDALILENYLREHEWPARLNFAMGVIDVKTPIVETPETVASRIERVAKYEKIGPERLLASTDCGFETFAGFGNVTYPVAIQKLQSLVNGASLAEEILTHVS
ncbi:MAG: cobalamin-independent methionine synthase II family protein [Nitrososphaerota archaeon]|nr:cobalamin-independent methionine synthase II family protein [Nitrososphaerota archaeon]